MVLTAEDRQLIEQAQEAFRRDFRYLEQVLWQSRARRPVASEISFDATSALV